MANGIALVMWRMAHKGWCRNRGGHDGSNDFGAGMKESLFKDLMFVCVCTILRYKI